jgi:hypothetical protein
MKRIEPIFNILIPQTGSKHLGGFFLKVISGFLCLLLLAACSAKPQLNVPIEELQRRLPPEPEKHMAALVLEFITLHSKINNSIVSANQILEGSTLPGQVDVAIAVLGYTADFLDQFKEKFEQIARYADENERQIAKVRAKFESLTDREKNALIYFETIKEPDARKIRTDYQEAVAVFIDAALAKAAFVKRNAREMTLGYPIDYERFDELSDRYDKARTDLRRTVEQVRESFDAVLDQTGRRYSPDNP